MTQGFTFDGGSFRDPASRVFYHDGGVYRVLNDEALADWQALSRTRLFEKAQSGGRLIGTTAVDPDRIPGLASDPRWAGLLHHEKIPFLSYPYEWSFGMLRDAALLVLELLQEALAEGLILKDGSAFNIQWRGCRPVFIDIPSFTRLKPGEPWMGYRQFCQTFLYPLFLQAYKGIAFQPWLRGSLDGIDPRDCYRLMGLRDLLRPGVLAHVYLQARLQDRYQATDRDLMGELRTAGFDQRLVMANARRLCRLIGSLRLKAKPSHWVKYAEQNSYSEADRDRKRRFVAEALGRRRWGQVWDLGSNTGEFSRMASAHADCVVAMDADPDVVETLYQSLKREERQNILPLVVDLMNPPAALGWRNRERKSLADRARPELILCLALVHHLVVGANVPLSDFVDWLSKWEAAVVIEFVTREDPMVRRLSRNKPQVLAGYEAAVFEKVLAERFTVRRREVLPGGTRILYHAEQFLKPALAT